MCVCVCVLVPRSYLTLCNPMEFKGARQAPLSMGFYRQEYWNGLPFPPPDNVLVSISYLKVKKLSCSLLFNSIENL